MMSDRIRWMTMTELELLSLNKNRTKPSRRPGESTNSDQILDLMDFECTEQNKCARKRIGRPRKWDQVYILNEYRKYTLAENSPCKKSVTDFTKKIGISRRNFYYILKNQRNKGVQNV